jgi:hypothetical protein
MLHVCISIEFVIFIAFVVAFVIVFESVLLRVWGRGKRKIKRRYGKGKGQKEMRMVREETREM